MPRKYGSYVHRRYAENEKVLAERLAKQPAAMRANLGALRVLHKGPPGPLDESGNVEKR
jgi:hypothetical protein